MLRLPQHAMIAAAVIERVTTGAKLLGLPPMTFLLACLVCTVSLIGQMAERPQAFLALIPGNTILAHNYVWNGLTAAFLETNLLKLGANLGAVVILGRALEPAWKWRKVLRTFSHASVTPS